MNFSLLTELFVKQQTPTNWFLKAREFTLLPLIALHTSIAELIHFVIILL